jgi:hypothetical protein
MSGRSSLRGLPLALAILALAACSPAGSGQATQSVAPTVAVTDAPRPTTATTPAAAATALPALTLRWEGSGPKQPNPCCQTWWPAIDPVTGDIWVADSFASQFWIFGPDGTFKESWGVPGTGPGQFDFSAHRQNQQAVGAIAFAPDGSFYVADDGNRRIERFDADRKYVSAWGGFGTGNAQFVNPFGIATDGQTVYVADDDRGDIQAFDAKGTYLRTFGAVVTEAGIFITVDHAGNLYRPNEQSGTISKYAPDGTLAATIAFPLAVNVVQGIAVDDAGHIYANTDGGGSPLVELDSTGTLLGQWSTGGETLAVDAGATTVYEANYTSPGWPAAVLRAYALP